MSAILLINTKLDIFALIERYFCRSNIQTQRFQKAQDVFYRMILPPFQRKDPQLAHRIFLPYSIHIIAQRLHGYTVTSQVLCYTPQLLYPISICRDIAILTSWTWFRRCQGSRILRIYYEKNRFLQCPKIQNRDFLIINTTLLFHCLQRGKAQFRNNGATPHIQPIKIK